MDALAAVDDDAGSGAVGACARGEEHGDTTNVLWRADAAGGLDALEQVAVLLEAVSGHARREDTGADGVDHDELFGERVGEHLGEVERRRLRGLV